MIFNKKFYLSFIFFSIFIVLGAFVFSETVTGSLPKVLNIGYFESEGLFYKTENDNLAGYYYEYLQNIASYLEIEYNFIECTYEDCLQKLKNKEFDILCSLPFMAFDDPNICTNKFNIGNVPVSFVTRDDEQNIVYNSFDSLQNKKVGYIPSRISLSYLNDFAYNHNVNCKFIACSNSEALKNGLDSKLLDIAAVTKATVHTNHKLAFRLPSLPFYFVALKENEHILYHFDEFISRLKRDNSNFEPYLYDKYFPQKRQIAFTQEEINYIKNVPKITMIYFERQPFEYTDSDGEFRGIVRDVMDKIVSISKLNIDYVPYNSILSKTIVDKSITDNPIIFTTSYNSSWAKENNILLSPVIFKIPVVSVKNSKEGNIIAWPQMTPIPKAFLEDNRTIQFFPSVKDCFVSIKNGNTNQTYVNMYVADYLLRQNPFRKLEFTNVTDIIEQSCLGIVKPVNHNLYSIFEKSINALNKNDLSNIVSYHTKEIDVFKFKDVFQIYSFKIVVIIFSICICICLLIIFYMSLKSHVDKENSTKLKYKADFDVLTNLWNKDKFYKETRKLLDNNPDVNFVIMVSDIEHFKVINDQFGVETGDDLLKYIAKDISCCPIDEKLTTVGYLEADHFVFCFPKNEKKFEQWYDRFMQHIENFALDFKIVFYFGLYVIDDLTVDVSKMCDRARLAVRSIKGDYLKHYTYYDSTEFKRLLEEQEIINQMNSALANKEFEVYLQPQYNHVTGNLIGAEALVRWNHPLRGLVSPIKFIPIFEKNGFITKLDEYIWERVCQILKNWTDRGISLIPISVNISRRDIYNPRLPDILLGLVTKYSIPPGFLKLEITESAYVENPDQLVDVVKRLRQMHFAVEMDDFGSGYSSLNSLKDVPVDLLKLDMKFLSMSKNSDRGGNILNSIVRMAKWLDLPVIAEGVETLAQADYLKSIGCHLVQGYLYSPPVPISEFEKIMEKSSCSIDETEERLKNSIDVNFFLTPNETCMQFFDNYVGPACVFELFYNNIEILRANDDFFTALNVTRNEFEPYRLNVLKALHIDDVQDFMNLLINAIDTKQTYEDVFRWTLFSQNNDQVKILVRVRHIAESSEHHMFFATIENIETLIGFSNEKNIK